MQWLQMYMLNIGAPNFIKQRLMGISIFNILFSSSDRSTKLVIIREITELNYIVDQMSSADICSISHLTDTEYAFFSAIHGTFSTTLCPQI